MADIFEICLLQDTPPHSPAGSASSHSEGRPPLKRGLSASSSAGNWVASPEWVSMSITVLEHCQGEGLLGEGG